MDNGASSYLRVLDGAAESFFEKAKAIDTRTDLYSRYVDGDDEAFVDLIRQYKDGLIFYLDSFTHNIFEAEDLAQETFVKIAIQGRKGRTRVPARNILPEGVSHHYGCSMHRNARCRGCFGCHLGSW